MRLYLLNSYNVLSLFIGSGNGYITLQPTGHRINLLSVYSYQIYFCMKLVLILVQATIHNPRIFNINRITVALWWSYVLRNSMIRSFIFLFLICMQCMICMIFYTTVTCASRASRKFNGLVFSHNKRRLITKNCIFSPVQLFYKRL